MSLVVGGEPSLSTEALLLGELGTSSLPPTSSCRAFLKTKFQVGFGSQLWITYFRMICSYHTGYVALADHAQVSFKEIS